MPLGAIASAVSRINCSLTSQANWFQLFQPMGGVRARPSSGLACAARPPGPSVRLQRSAKTESTGRDTMDPPMNAGVG